MRRPRTWACAVLALAASLRASGQGSGMSLSPTMDLTQLEAALNAYPPGADQVEQRALIAASFDRQVTVRVQEGLTDDDRAALRPLLEFYRRRVDLGLDALAHTTVTEGVLAVKVYSSSLVLKSAQGTVALDYCQGPVPNGREPEEADQRRCGFYLTPEQRDRLAGLVDVQLITHRHHDHADYSLAKRLIDLGRTVIGPPQMQTYWRSFGGRITVPEFGTEQTFGPVTIYTMLGRQCAKSEAGPDGQGVGVPNPDNPDADSQTVVYLLRIGGVTILQAAENHDPADAWLRGAIARGFVPNVFCSLGQYQGARTMQEAMRELPRPNWLPIHEYEMTHENGGNRTIGWFTGNLGKAVAEGRAMPLFWGEHYLFTPGMFRP